MKCDEYREKLVEYIEGLLPDQETQRFKSHLEQCSVCRTELDQLTALSQRLTSDAKNRQSADIENRVVNRIICEQNRQLKQTAGMGCQLQTWRIIIKSKITKLTAAAIILIAAIFSLTLFNKTVSPAYALEQMRNAMKDTVWMHVIANMKGFGEPISEYWYSPSLGIDVSRNDKGLVSFTDIKKQESCVYDPNINTLTLFNADQNIFYKANTVSDLIDLIIMSLNENTDARMTTTTESSQGQLVDIHAITIPRGESGTEVWKFIVEKKSRLLKQMKLEGWNEKGTFIEFADYTFDYPETGPMNIYDLNVPRTHIIVDKRPSGDIKTIIHRYETARQDDLIHYTALILFIRHNNNGQQVAEEATIVYTNGILQRKEQLSLRWNLIEAQRKNQLNLISQMGNTLDSMLTWWENPEHLSRRLGSMSDGKYHYTICHSLNINERQNREDTDIKKRRSNNEPESYYLSWIGVGDFFRFDRDHPELTLIENDYSKQHHLICFQKLDEVNGPESIKYKMPHGRRYKRLCYLDPQKDHICCRMETYLIQDEHWQREYKNSEKYLVKNTDPSLEFTEREIREITEYSQNSLGKWLPREIKWHTTSQLENAKVEDSINSVKFYLDTERDIPESIFDKDAFSKYLSE